MINSLQSAAIVAAVVCTATFNTDVTANVTAANDDANDSDTGEMIRLYQFAYLCLNIPVNVDRTSVFMRYDVLD